MGRARGWAGLMIAVAGLGLVARGQEDKPKPKVSDQPLTAEQLAVYRGFFVSWASGAPAEVNLTAVTEAAAGTDGGGDARCALSAAEPAPTEVHRFRAEDLAQLGPMKLRLMDADRGSTEVKENDPEKGMGEGQSVKEAVENAFRHGLFTLSEIRFNREHTRAVLTYGFVCGGLCGNGGKMVLAKQADGTWKAIRRCAEWVS